VVVFWTGAVTIFFVDDAMTFFYKLTATIDLDSGTARA
jgi:hypothetical protein